MSASTNSHIAGHEQRVCHPNTQEAEAEGTLLQGQLSDTGDLLQIPGAVNVIHLIQHLQGPGYRSEHQKMG